MESLGDISRVDGGVVIVGRVVVAFDLGQHRPYADWVESEVGHKSVIVEQVHAQTDHRMTAADSVQLERVKMPSVYVALQKTSGRLPAATRRRVHARQHVFTLT